MEAAQETITSGTETQETASASSPEMSYPRDPVPTRGIARTEAQNPEDTAFSRF